MSADMEADRLLVQARGSSPAVAARLVFEAFLAVSRTTDGSALLPLVDHLHGLWAAQPTPEIDYLYHLLAGVIGVRARQPGGPERRQVDALGMY